MMIPHRSHPRGESWLLAGGSRTSRGARRGITIIEVIVVMTGVATLLGLCAVTLQLLHERAPHYSEFLVDAIYPNATAVCITGKIAALEPSLGGE